VETVLFQVAVFVAAAVVAVPLAQRLGFGSVLGYLAAGVAIGPVLGLVGGTEAEDVRHYAEFGVVLMLFLIGLEMEPKALWDMRLRLVGLGGLQVTLTLAAVAAVCLALGVPWNQAIAIGMVLCLSSTAIVMQTLSEKRLTRTEGGRASFAVLLFQDLAAIPFLALLPILAYGGVAPPPDGELAAVTALPAWAHALLVLGVAALVVLAGQFLTRPLFRFISWARLHEIYIAAALLFVVGIALGMTMVGLSPALGTFLAGVVLANSEYRHELQADLAPFKGLLLGLFFMAVGAEVDLALLLERPLAMLGLTVCFMGLKLAILYALARLFRLPEDAGMLFTLALAQAGEFGFFLVNFALDVRLLPPGRTDAVLLVISLSMVLTPALFLLHDRLSMRGGPAAKRAPDAIDERGTVIVAGMGRFGQTVNRLLAGLGVKTVVIDSELARVEEMRALGIRGFYGDVGRPEMLVAAGIDEARAVVLAIDDHELALEMTRFIAKRYPQVRVIARAKDRYHVLALSAAGAQDSVREVFGSAVEAGKRALAALGYQPQEIEGIAETFTAHERATLAELAAVWDPNVPPERNPAYLAKVREQQAIFEAEVRRSAAPPDTPDGPEAGAERAREAGAQQPVRTWTGVNKLI
jgi:CPA2 family monovalent cation:H+ antiporter-2